MSDTPVKVVIDCSASGVPDAAFADQFDEAALEQIRAGNLEAAARLMDEAKTIRDAAAVPAATVVPLTDDELAQRDLDEATGLETAKAARAGEVRAALAATDQWAARAVEDAVAMPAARVKYRQKLRGLFATIDAAASFADLDKVAIPDQPAPPS